MNSYNRNVSIGNTESPARVASGMAEGARFHLCILVFINLGVGTDLLIGNPGNGGPPGTSWVQPTQQQRAQTQPPVSTPNQWSNPGMSNVADNPIYFSGGRIFQGGCPRPLLEGGANLTSYRPANRTPGWNPIIRV